MQVGNNQRSQDNNGFAGKFDKIEAAGPTGGAFFFGNKGKHLIAG